MQTCCSILDSFSDGSFGSAGRDAAEVFRLDCSAKFPLAVKFQTVKKQQKEEPAVKEKEVVEQIEA